jgi:hypothetical protein
LNQVFAAVWGMGAAFETINGIDYRTMFSDWWRETYRDVCFLFFIFFSILLSYLHVHMD